MVLFHLFSSELSLARGGKGKTKTPAAPGRGLLGPLPGAARGCVGKSQGCEDSGWRAGDRDKGNKRLVSGTREIRPVRSFCSTELAAKLLQKRCKAAAATAEPGQEQQLVSSELKPPPSPWWVGSSVG